MTLYYSAGSATHEISDPEMQTALHGVFDQLGNRTNVLALPPDFTRYNSRAGQLTCMAYEYFQQRPCKRSRFRAEESVAACRDT